jgi:hypothetical protein
MRSLITRSKPNSRSHRIQAQTAQQIGGGERDRTDDPLLAKQVLSQLSYTPMCQALVGLVGLEPTTPALSRRCSNQLSYRPSLSLLVFNSRSVWALAQPALSLERR